jgi:hypothetical protein
MTTTTDDLITEIAQQLAEHAMDMAAGNDPEIAAKNLADMLASIAGSIAERHLDDGDRGIELLIDAAGILSAALDDDGTDA